MSRSVSQLRAAFLGPFGSSLNIELIKASQVLSKALLRPYYGAIKALLRPYYGAMKALLSTIKTLLGVY